MRLVVWLKSFSSLVLGRESNAGGESKLWRKTNSLEREASRAYRVVFTRNYTQTALQRVSGERNVAGCTWMWNFMARKCGAAGVFQARSPSPTMLIWDGLVRV